MKHVFVETNFMVEVLRPFPAPRAMELLDRTGRDVTLYVPWVSLVEVKRTLDRVIREDLGFDDAMMKRAGREMANGSLGAAEHRTIQQFADATKVARGAALASVGSRVDSLASRLVVIEPTKEVVSKTLALFPVKSLPPFDEMVLGAVLVKAAELYAAGAADMFFCNLNKKDFDARERPALATEYEACGLVYMPGFDVP